METLTAKAHDSRNIGGDILICCISVIPTQNLRSRYPYFIPPGSFDLVEVQRLATNASLKAKTSYKQKNSRHVHVAVVVLCLCSVNLPAIALIHELRKQSIVVVIIAPRVI